MVRFLNLLNVRLRIMMKHWSFIFMYIGLCVITVILVSQLYEEINQGVEIPVGFVDLDQTDFSRHVIEEMEGNPLIKVIVFEEAEGIRAVKNQSIEVLYTIQKDANENVRQGDFEDIFEMTYIDGNYFASMLSDIFSGEYLDEISLRLASDYYARGYKLYIGDSVELEEENLVYQIGKGITFKDRDSYFIRLTLIDEGEVIPLEWYNQNVLFEKMTIGIVYIFIAFFIMFGGIHILKDRESMIYLKVRQSGIKTIWIIVAEYLTLVFGGILISIPLTLVSVYYGEDFGAMIVINGLYVLSTSAMIYLFIQFFKGVMSYTIIGTGLVIGMGIVSGSFFSIDTLSDPIANVARFFPAFYSVQTYFDKGFVMEYSIYTMCYLVVSLFIIYMLSKRKLKVAIH